ncbi:MAG: GNAT family N-acetyltransferase [Candidatus Heimdallarchaeota archaeon]|nr:GNAT family N-acetyltransferase [Candidatus Heimdallarchaeota archaeon]
MSVKVQDKSSIAGWSHLIKNYLREVRKVSNEKKISEILDSFAGDLEANERFAVVAYKDGKPVGYLTGRPYGIVFETSSFYLLHEALEGATDVQLVDTLAQKAFNELGFHYFRQNIALPFEFSPTFLTDLKEKDFKVIERCEMSINPKQTEILEPTLPPTYSFELFRKEKAKEVIRLICEANEPGHPDLAIYPEMREMESIFRIFARLTEEFEALDVTLNPVIVKGKGLVGASIVLKDSPTEAYIAQASINPHHQKQGLGKALMYKIITECKNQGINRLLLAVTKNNFPAYKLYQKLGFKEIAQYLAIGKEKQK